MESAQDFIQRKNEQFKKELEKNKQVSMKDIGRRGTLKFIREKWFFLPATNLPNAKVFRIEKLRKAKAEGELAYPEAWREGDVEYRVGYYMIGKIGRAKNKWVWGQFCPIIPVGDLEKIIKQIKKMEIK